MTNPATVTSPDAKGAPAPIRLNPFARASIQGESPFLDETVVPGASTVALSPQGVTADGYLRSVVIHVESSGSAGAATFAADGPFSAIGEIALVDVNGANIVGPFTGFDLYLAHLTGGYVGNSQVKLAPDYSASTADGSFSFFLRVPVEISQRDGFGSLPNMNAGATYQLKISAAPLASIYSANPAGADPTGIRFRAWEEVWKFPPAADLNGAPNAQNPPGEGTTQYWTKQNPSFVNGANANMRLTRVGNIIRNLVFVARTAAGARSNLLTGNFTLRLDGQEIFVRDVDYWRQLMFERGLPTETGLYVVDFTHDFDGRLGNEMRDLWLPTMQSTKLEISFTASAAGSLDILTNDIAAVSAPFMG